MTQGEWRIMMFFLGRYFVSRILFVH